MREEARTAQVLICQYICVDLYNIQIIYIYVDDENEGGNVWLVKSLISPLFSALISLISPLFSAAPGHVQQEIQHG